MMLVGNTSCTILWQIDTWRRPLSREEEYSSVECTIHGLHTLYKQQTLVQINAFRGMLIATFDVAACLSKNQSSWCPRTCTLAQNDKVA